MGALEDGIQARRGGVPPAITQGAEMDSEIQDSAVDKPLHLLQHQPLRQTMEEVHC
jgi:hypothetical protein